MYANKKSNKHVLPITITKSEEVQLSNKFLLMLHRRFANATPISCIT